MAMCINKNSTEFKRLSRISGMSDEDLALNIMVTQEEKGRWPEIDELFNPDSSKAMAEDFGLKDLGYVMKGDANNILSGTDEDSFVKSLNNKYKDYNTTSMILDDVLLIYPVKRATIATSDYSNKFNVEKDSGKGKNISVLRAIASRMEKLYGIKFHLFNDSDIKDMDELNGVNVSDKNAFILNGDIYINLDNASIDAPIHEMMHMMLGELKFNNPQLYNKLVESASMIPNYRYIRQTMFANMMEHDAMEEIFVMESARYLSGLPSMIDKLPLKERSMIDYSIMRMIDSSIMGSNTAMGYDINQLKNKSIIDLCEMLGSNLVNSKQSTSDMGFKSRLMMNKKMDLAQRGILTEKCI